jgi:hypothetical protein
VILEHALAVVGAITVFGWVLTMFEKPNQFRHWTDEDE